MKVKLMIVLTMLLTLSSLGTVLAAESCKCEHESECEAKRVESKAARKAIIFEVESVEPAENGAYITVFSSKQDLYATISAAACKDYQMIKPGTKLKLWYEIMTMSLPARTNAVKAKIIKN